VASPAESTSRAPRATSSRSFKHQARFEYRKKPGSAPGFFFLNQHKAENQGIENVLQCSVGMKILIASIPVPGHLNPVLGVAGILVKHGHEVVVLTGSQLKPVVEAAGMPFRPLSEANMGPSEYFAKYPERHEKSPGMEMFGFDMEHYFLANLPGQARGLEEALRSFPADIVLAESFFFGTLALLLGPREKRPSIVHLGVSVLSHGSGKTVPPAAGMTEEEREISHQQWENLLRKPLQKAFDKVLTELGCHPLPCPVLESMLTLPDLYLHPGIESFQYVADSLRTSAIRYIGRIPLPPGQYALPEWWRELDKTKRLVLVTQGTIANRNFGQLVGPALQGLRNEKDLFILVTTGEQPAESIPVEIPANARVTSFLPYEQILSDVDLLITNGGYGTVNMALAHGVPIVSAGLTEDKEEVSANVQWSGAGIDLRTNEPGPEAIRSAAREILDSAMYRDRARELAQEFAQHDTEAELLSLLEACTESVHA
jgi:MGT family glycosyltransferase